MPPLEREPDTVKSTAEILAGYRAARARLWGAAPARPVVVRVAPVSPPPPRPLSPIVPPVRRSRAQKPAPTPASKPHAPNWIPSRVPVRAVQEATCEHFGLSVDDMLSGRKAVAFARPRQVAIYITWKLAPLTYPIIARAFGNRDHTTIIAAKCRIEKLLDEGDLETAAAVKLIMSMLERRFPNATGHKEERNYYPRSEAPRNGMPWTDEERQHVINALNEGISAKTIANELGRSPDGVRHIGNAAGIFPRHPRKMKLKSREATIP